MSLGKGAIVPSSSKQKINTHSSTKEELVGVDDMMSKILWTRYFIEAQGYSVGPSIIYQDNQSTILLENNGHASSKQTKHVNVWYFFVTDQIKSNEVKVEYCPTTQMKADFFTKPLQAQLFYALQAEILNIDHDDGANVCHSNNNNNIVNDDESSYTWSQHEP